MASSSSSLSHLELSLSLKPSYVPKTVENVLRDLQEVKNPSDKLMMLNDYIHQHEEELNCIQQIKCQIPQCGLFLEEAIKTLTKESERIKKSIEYEDAFVSQVLSQNSEFMKQKQILDQKPLTERKRKRISWTPYLHSLFESAVIQAGGIKDATPSQIKEYMKVRGVTTDHIKSHLQKYRLQHRLARVDDTDQVARQMYYDDLGTQELGVRQWGQGGSENES